MENGYTENLKICITCGAKNKPAYKYCRDCGAPLPESGSFTASNSGSNYRTENRYNGETFNSGNAFGEITSEELFCYTGNDIKMYNKLCDVAQSPKKRIWCWPLFLLGFFFGFLGMSCWYFYHKMYKPAVALLAVGLVTSGVSEYYCFEFLSDILKTVKGVNINSSNLDDFIELIFKNSVVSLVGLVCVTFLFFVLRLLAIIILPMYAYKSYFNNGVSYILKCREQNMPVVFAKGGKNTGVTVAVAVGCVIFNSVLSNIFSQPVLNELVNILSYYSGLYYFYGSVKLK